MSYQVEVTELPKCDICKDVLRMTSPPDAYADAKTSDGRWGNVCRKHFVTEHCRLGIGRGQRLILKKK